MNFKKLSTKQTGTWAEQRACRYLSKQGLKLVDQNYSCSLGEIDLIMMDKTCLVFIEVRFRRDDYFGGGIASVTYRKQQKLIRTAYCYLKSTGQLGTIPCRFDVVGVSGTESKLNFNWVKDAFRL